MGLKGEAGMQGERGPLGPEGLQVGLFFFTATHAFKFVSRARREKGERMEKLARTELLDFLDLLGHLALPEDMT